ncbi:cytochrome c-type biogenesis protein CcmF [Nitrospirillum amazonense]|uniref:Cytochrome c-type biogenesis protein CcmF n=1 Tax=Nitrospirillum amazonense TaxID=28077 RepID=A0A560K132_9PROT|nr:heme lyase CcmF/NrfE family subunit [Nitrospirillum amazonense]TWB75494.1 cytochrome c-type biogenesis protein CcmF [Nitrospirillum amazonense]
MIPELGHYALVLALVVALVQSVIPLWGAARRDAAMMEVGRTAAYCQFAALALAFGALTYAHVVSDFSVLNVVENSHTDKPMLYKVAGVWGNHEGSLVLWVFILALFGALVAAFGRNLPASLRARVLAVQGMIGVGFLWFMVATSNPFTRVDPAPLNGHDLNPLLQDPGLAFHPPFLYLGYVGFSLCFSFAAGALIEGRVDAAWARWVRPWALIAWSSLTLGIAMGSWWSYYTLGWGGWWFWDPVENASLMPWLAGTALLHSAIVVEKRDTLKSWTILLAIVTFTLSLMGTFLVRSGVLTSVHAFASDPARGVFILALLVVATGGGLLLYALRAPVLKAGGLFAPISREGGLVLNNLLLSTACATVFLGTLYPLFMDAVGGGKISIGPPFFNATFVPLMVPVVAVMALGPLLSWKRADLAGVLGRLKIAALVGVVAALAALWLAGTKPVLAVLALGLAGWAVMGAVVDVADRIRLFRMPLSDSISRARHLPRGAWGTAIAHAGLGVAVAGMVGTSAWTTEAIQVLHIGQSVDVAGYSFRLDSVAEAPGPNYTARRAVLTVTRNGDFVATLAPEQRFYPVTRMTTTGAAIHTNFFSDLYAVVGEPAPDGTGYNTRFYRHPLVPWIWVGSILMMAGGLVSLSDRRLRVGVPLKRAVPRAAAAVPPAPAE